MHSLSLPSHGTTTNGTWLVTQFHANMIKGMLTWHDTWGPRYGVLPGYGIFMQNGFQLGWICFVQKYFYVQKIQRPFKYMIN